MPERQIGHVREVNRLMFEAGSRLDSITAIAEAKVRKGEMVGIADLAESGPNMVGAAYALEDLAQAVSSYGKASVENGSFRGGLILSTRFSKLELLFEGPKVDRGKFLAFTPEKELATVSAAKDAVKALVVVSNDLSFMDFKVGDERAADLVTHLQIAADRIMMVATRVNAIHAGDAIRPSPI